jgi:hypothetical protein
MYGMMMHASGSPLWAFCVFYMQVLHCKIAPRPAPNAEARHGFKFKYLGINTNTMPLTLTLTLTLKTLTPEPNRAKPPDEGRSVPEGEPTRTKIGPLGQSAKCGGASFGAKRVF